MARRDLRERAVRAALAAGAEAGFSSDGAVVLQDTNNVVVWLVPHDVIAKVGVWPHSAEVLDREVRVCAALAARAAPVAPPVAEMRIERSTGLPVSLWARLPPTAPASSAAATDLAAMLSAVHAAMGDLPIELPPYLAALDHARITLFDDDSMAALASSDLEMLRGAFERWATVLRERPLATRPLHGEPHLGNVIVTVDGPHLVDFEAASTGPVEWDLASLSAEVAVAYGTIDTQLLVVCRLMNSARVATWGWAQAGLPEMRHHGEHHLRIVRAGVET